MIEPYALSGVVEAVYTRDACDGLDVLLFFADEEEQPGLRVHEPNSDRLYLYRGVDLSDVFYGRKRMVESLCRQIDEALFLYRSPGMLESFPQITL